MRRLLPAAAFLLLVATAPFLSGLASRPAPASLDCSQCHTCEHPTAEEPCLAACARHAMAAELSSQLGPQVVILDDLEDLYVPVRFNHRAHADMSGMGTGCETCHHYTPPNSPHPACRDCHPVEIQHEDISQPGLKGAYHRQCLSCHAAWDKDTACEVCHEKKAGGRLGGTATVASEHRHYSEIPLDDVILFPTTYDEGDQVPFHHRNHSQAYERDCVECHREQSCTRCHVQGGQLHPMGALNDVDLHDLCYECHDPDPCTQCHGRDPDDLFSHAETGWPLAAYHADLSCRACHGASGAFQTPKPVCTGCHPADWVPRDFDHASVGVVLDETHGELDCSDCHEGGLGSPTSCGACHDDERTYESTGGFSSD
jgi:hypothetical protein